MKGPCQCGKSHGKAPPLFQREISTTYDYLTTANALAYQKVRTEPKGFYQRRPDPALPGQWWGRPSHL